ncbi:hypothetical protein AYO45_03145 [Gammaproteobacteria bacterium SCGC AG-212-F23]|nr:hypothetical protein AYO45_03145 [Gammaproteobacteria bacterium SCGC AG-212-F23]
MARHGISYQDVVKAANEVKSQGKNITIEHVRAILGTGSISTIHNHLRKWKEVQGSYQAVASPESLPEDLFCLVKSLWERLCESADEKILLLKENHQQEIHRLNQEVEKYKANNQRWQKLFDQWQIEKSQLSNEKQTVEQALAFSHKENTSLHGKQDALLQQLRERQDRIEELHRLHKQSQENLEHYRESVRAERIRDQEQYERQKQQWQSEIQSLHQELVTQQQKTTILQQSHAALDKNYTLSQAQLQQSTKQLKEIEKINAEYLQANQQWQQQYKELQKVLESKTHQLMELKAENKLLSQQLADVKSVVNDFQEQNKLLVHDKWLLAEEKAQLTGQLKQIRKMETA